MWYFLCLHNIFFLLEVADADQHLLKVFIKVIIASIFELNWRIDFPHIEVMPTPVHHHLER